MVVVVTGTAAVTGVEEAVAEDAGAGAVVGVSAGEVVVAATCMVVCNLVMFARYPTIPIDSTLEPTKIERVNRRTRASRRSRW